MIYLGALPLSLYLSKMFLAKLGEGTTAAVTEESLGGLFGTALSLVATMAGLFVMYHMVMGAMMWINSAGEKEKVDKARKRITNALIGLVLLFLVLVVYFTVVTDVLGIFEKDAAGNIKLVLPYLFGP